jgi:hypothetical protein
MSNTVFKLLFGIALSGTALFGWAAFGNEPLDGGSEGAPAFDAGTPSPSPSSGADPAKLSPTIQPLRIFVIANKRWEADPIAGVLLSPGDRFLEGDLKTYGWKPPAALPGSGLYGFDKTIKSNGLHPLAVLTYPNQAEVLLWSLQDIVALDSSLAEEDGKVGNKSSLRKFLALKTFLSHEWLRANGYEAPNLVISVGTAACDGVAPCSGQVMIGSKVFAMDAETDEADHPNLRWKKPDAPLDEILLSPSAGGINGEELLTRVAAHSEDLVKFAKTRVLKAPRSVGMNPLIKIDENGVAVSSVNILANDDYSWADRFSTGALLKAVKKAGKQNTESAKLVQTLKVGSVETTHAVIRAASDVPFLYVSGFVNRLGQFDTEVDPAYYAQNFVGAHNAGVVLEALLPAVIEAMRSAPTVAPPPSAATPK